MVAAGAESRNRTGDTLIFSQVLYQLSYLGADRIVIRVRTNGIFPCKVNTGRV